MPSLQAEGLAWLTIVVGQRCPFLLHITSNAIDRQTGMLRLISLSILRRKSIHNDGQSTSHGAFNCTEMLSEVVHTTVTIRGFLCRFGEKRKRPSPKKLRGLVCSCTLYARRSSSRASGLCYAQLNLDHLCQLPADHNSYIYLNFMPHFHRTLSIRSYFHCYQEP
jgi:hypothetical protein